MEDKTNTPNEVIELVDENDQVIGETTKGEANKNPEIIHREIGVLIYDKRNRILLQKRNRKKTVLPGYWTVASEGHVPKGKTVRESAHMELLEELGFDTKLKFAYKILVRAPNETHFVYFYTGKYAGEKVNFEKAEIEKVKFFSEREFKKLLVSGAKVEEESIDFAEKFWTGNK